MAYAEATSVSVEKSKAEIEAILMRYGASQFASAWESGKAMIGFTMNGRMIRFVLPLPDAKDKQFTLTPKGRHIRHPEDRQKAWEQSCRSRWRALCLCIKAKLEAIQSGITTFE